eukprot:TRINITY_DN5805_c0_g1_i1.p1 TRINITY_DN5805_c0_g1~~TRINITY_DN5805_c0_g1_i1.p1  ORF type:complete len:101 (+),score=22.45 TRINITY_DN5805_c0_g1_i1:3-305(+)
MNQTQHGLSKVEVWLPVVCGVVLGGIGNYLEIPKIRGKEYFKTIREKLVRVLSLVPLGVFGTIFQIMVIYVDIKYLDNGRTPARGWGFLVSFLSWFAVTS